MTTENTNPADNMIKINTFCEVTVDTYADKGVDKGDVVFIATLRPLPIDENDLYLQRLFVGVHLTDDYSVKLPEMYLMDPRELVKIDEETTKIYRNQMEFDFENKDTVVAT